ncbi:MAG: DUF362 domain-containing protein [Syntrophaceae bacterium]|nr:DUF362 domain-containing protein [Syntrophaceae bacterium]
MDSHQRITRRRFLKTAAAGVALGVVGSPALMHAKEEYDLVVISGEPAAATKKALETLGGISRFVKKGHRVVLKPNMSFARTPEFGATTHPMVVAAVAQECIRAGARRVLILDHTLHRAELCLERTGIREACKNISGVHVQAFQDRKFFKEIKIPQGKVLDRVEVIQEALESDLLINIPVAKSHSATGVSLGIKGLMGLIWDRESFHSRFNINQALSDLATVIKPQLTIIDATRALASGGPGGPGDVKKTNLIIAGTDPVAVDSYGVTIVPWYGQTFKGRQVEHLLIAHQRGLGKIDIEQLKIFKGSA